MCGIAGIVRTNLEPASNIIVQNMLNAIAHRGPDGQGVINLGPVVFGHRRLAIIDLSNHGAQPIQTEDGRYTLTFNGEIYNFRELRAELESKGKVFQSRSDSEVLLKAFAEWGLKALNKLNGMFAFAIWDKLEKMFYLVRDRYGIKPVYYCKLNYSFTFASEIKAFPAHPEFSTQMSEEGLFEYLAFQNFYSDRTLFKNVHILPAGHYLSLNLNQTNAVPVISQYWDFCFEEPINPKSEQDYTDELDFLFKQSISRQLVSDVDVGSYLSGGMDSGSITALAAQEFPGIKTFTCGFDLNSVSGFERSFDERAAAEHLSYLFKTEHYEMVLKASDMERVMPKLMWHLEEPRVGQSYPNFYIAQLASKFCKVVLSGSGGDELFGGYPWRYYHGLTDQNFDTFANQYSRYWQRLVPQGQVEPLVEPIKDKVKHLSALDIFKNVFSNKANKRTLYPEDCINHALYLEAKTFLHGLLVMEDKLSMAHGLEARVPFLDNDLVDFAMKLPVKLKLASIEKIKTLNSSPPEIHSAGVLQKSNDGKVLLRKIMAKYIPSSITDREKQGFSAPDASWFKGESKPYLQNLLLNKNTKISQYLNASIIKDLINEHFDGNHNRRLLIWSLISLENWCQVFM